MNCPNCGKAFTDENATICNGCLFDFSDVLQCPYYFSIPQNQNGCTLNKACINQGSSLKFESCNIFMKASGIS